MAINKRLSYIFLDPANTALGWQGITIDFDSAIDPVSDVIAEQRDIRTTQSSERDMKFIIVEDI